MLLGTALCLVLTQSPLQPTHLHLLDDPIAVAGPVAPAEPAPAAERGTVWWTVLGVTDGILYVGTIAFIIAGAAMQWKAGGGYGVALAGSTFVGAAAGGFGGYYLGDIAREGSLGGRVALVVLAGIAVTASLAAVAFGIASLSSSGLGFTPN